MSQTTSTTAKQSLLQGLAILTSILLAFWIDAWWQEQKEREQEVEALQALAEGLEQLQVNMDWTDRYSHAILEATTELTHMCGTPIEDIDPAHVDQLLATTGYYNGAGDLGGAIVEIGINGPALADIESPSLRFKLTRLAGVLDEIKLYLEMDTRFIAEEFNPYIRQHANSFQLIEAQRHLPGHPDQIFPSPEAPIGEPVDHRELLCNRVFRNLMIERHDRLADLRSQGFPQLKTSLEEANSAVEEALK